MKQHVSQIEKERSDHAKTTSGGRRRHLLTCNIVYLKVTYHKEFAAETANMAGRVSRLSA
jgi:hypothetical protein